jgi:hypothetical protein
MEVFEMENVVTDTTRTFQLEFFGKVPAKKNSLIPTKKGPVINTGTRDSISRLELQVPGIYRDINLKHPDLEFAFYMPEGRSDRDNMVTTLLDVLCKMGVLENDTVAKCNGTITIHPAKYAPDYTTYVVIRQNDSNNWKTPRKKNTGELGCLG